MFENLWANIRRNWETSIPGVISSIALFVAIFYPDSTAFINKVAGGIAAVTYAIGMLLAKSGSVTGTAANPRAVNSGDKDPGPIVPKVPNL